MRNLQKIDLESYINDFKTLTLTIYFADDSDDQLDMLNKLISSAVDKHAPLVRTKRTRPP